MRKLIRASLEALDQEIQETVNRQHGPKLLRGTRPNLILFNLDLTDLDAMQCLRELDIQRADRPVLGLLLSAGLGSGHLPGMSGGLAICSGNSLPRL